MTPKIDSIKTVCEGTHLSLNEIEFTDDRGRKRRWESTDRIGSGGRGACVILARIVPDNEVLLVRQFRPPAGKLMLEFPAGLIDPGENALDAARRELLEETGYEGTVIAPERGGIVCYSSPGMTGEQMILVRMTVDGAYYRKHPPVPHPEDTESIEVFHVAVDRLDAFVKEQYETGVGIDAKIFALLFGFSAGMRAGALR